MVDCLLLDTWKEILSLYKLEAFLGTYFLIYYANEK